MGEKEEEDTAGGGEEEKEGGAMEEEEQEEVATEDLVEKGTVALSETTTHWLLSVAGTRVAEIARSCDPGSEKVENFGRK